MECQRTTRNCEFAVQLFGVLGLLLIQPASAIAAGMPITPYFFDSAGRGWASLAETWSVLPERFLAVCDPTTGKCNGTLSDPSVWGDREIDLTGWIWASRVESLNLISEYTAIPLEDLITGLDDYWWIECGDDEGNNDNCPSEFFAWGNLVIDNATRHGHSSISFNGVSRDDILSVDEDGEHWTAWSGYWLGEGRASFGSGGGDVSGVRAYCVDEFSGAPSDEECWEAWGHFLYLPASVPEPRVLVLLAFGLIAAGASRRIALRRA
jgi:hypothetical protein